MNTIKNIHIIADRLSEAELQKLEAGASLHKRYSNILFKIIEINNDELHIRTEQGKNLSENYADEKTLITRTRELFGPLFPGKTIYTHPVPYRVALPEVVDTAWINEKMLKKGVRIKDMVIDTGIDKSNFSAWINGTRPMSQIVKSMFYFYLTR